MDADNFFLKTISPNVWAILGCGFAMGLSGVGAAWYVMDNILLLWLIYPRGFSLIGTSLMGAAVKAPRIRSRNLVRYCVTIVPFAVFSCLSGCCGERVGAGVCG
jgi:V-type H+-transporting ATPase proteolipid subunit